MRGVSEKPATREIRARENLRPALLCPPFPRVSIPCYTSGEDRMTMQHGAPVGDIIGLVRVFGGAEIEAPCRRVFRRNRP